MGALGVLAGLVGGLAAVGVLLALSGWTPGRSSAVGRLRADWRAALVPLSFSAVSAIIVFAATGWVVAGLSGGVAGWMAHGAWHRRRVGSGDQQERIEALATWCEQLRDLLAADQGIASTIVATAKVCPRSIAEPVATLASRLGRQQPSTAIAQFADDLDDPSADLVATVLLEATRRSSRTAELLSELAVTIRDRAAMRLRIEAERSGHRGEARFIIGFTAVVVGGIVVFGRDSDFLAAYDSPSGQLVLSLVIGFFSGGIWWLSRLTRYERPARFLSLLGTGAGPVVDAPGRPAGAAPGNERS